MLFAGTTVASGQGAGIVTATGMRTEIGQVQQQITAAKCEAQDSPLSRNLEAFGAAPPVKASPSEGSPTHQRRPGTPMRLSILLSCNWRAPTR